MIVLALIYFGLAALGCVLVTRVVIPTWVRAAVILVLPALAFAVWRAAQPSTGWPSVSKPSPGAQLVGGYVREPDQLSHDRGEIDLLLVPPDSSRPRLYRTPYNRQTHKQLLMALGAARKGVRVGVKMVKRPRGQDNGPRVKPQFYRLPDPVLPRKG